MKFGKRTIIRVGEVLVALVLIFGTVVVLGHFEPAPTSSKASQSNRTQSYTNTQQIMGEPTSATNLTVQQSEGSSPTPEAASTSSNLNLGLTTGQPQSNAVQPTPPTPEPTPPPVSPSPLPANPTPLPSNPSNCITLENGTSSCGLSCNPCGSGGAAVMCPDRAIEDPGIQPICQNCYPVNNVKYLCRELY